MNETATRHASQETKIPEKKAEDSKPILAEGTGGADPVVRFKVDGAVKSLNRPVRGMDLYRVAGDPKSLKVGGKEIKNNFDIVDVEDDAEIKTSH